MLTFVVWILFEFLGSDQIILSFSIFTSCHDLHQTLHCKHLGRPAVQTKTTVEHQVTASHAIMTCTLCTANTLVGQICKTKQQQNNSCMSSHIFTCRPWLASFADQNNSCMSSHIFTCRHLTLFTANILVSQLCRPKQQFVHHTTSLHAARNFFTQHAAQTKTTVVHKVTALHAIAIMICTLFKANTLGNKLCRPKQQL